MAVFLGAHVVNDFYSTILPAFLPAVADALDLDYTELGILSFAFIIFSGVLQPLLGKRADQSGKRRALLVFGFAIGAVGFLAMSVAPNFWIIVAVSLLCGLGSATYHPQAASYIVSAFPDRPGRMLGLHGWGGSAGHFLAPVVAVFLIAAFDWRIAFALVALPMVIAAVVVQRTLDESEPSPSITFAGVLSRDLLIVAVVFGLNGMVGRSFLTFFVKMVVDEGWEATDAGFVLTLILLGGAIAQPLGGMAFDRLGGRSVVVFASAATLLLVGAFAVTDGALSLVIIAGIAFFQFSLFPVALAQATALVPSTQTSTATGIVFGLSGLMIAVAQPVVGALAEAAGDIRVALAQLLPVAVLALLLGFMTPGLAPHDVAV